MPVVVTIFSGNNVSFFKSAVSKLVLSPWSTKTTTKKNKKTKTKAKTKKTKKQDTCFGNLSPVFP